MFCNRPDRPVFLWNFHFCSDWILTGIFVFWFYDGKTIR
ncbi:hypothetical protein LEP1GSC193_0833 [Leptospira alstonii serovar Pingchang str. 80-412]|nr:hypothetical protein LEP1GSC193_0833 [Leptospira alstonii serovar Pingchang str. 80-412]